MSNKLFIIVITIIISLLCLFYISFTFVAGKIERQAVSTGNTDLVSKTKYLDSLADKPVYNVLGYEYTFREVKARELKLGLDLQGGMYLVMEVSQEAIIKSLAGKTSDPLFLAALDSAKADRKDSRQQLIHLFYDHYKHLKPDGRLSDIFVNASNQDLISYASSDKEILQFIEKEISEAVDRSYEILRNRIDKFGVTQPIIQKLPGTDRIQIELPGVEDPERVRKLLQGTAKLEFHEVFTLSEIQPHLSSVNDFWLSLELEKAGKNSSAGAEQTGENIATLLAGDSIVDNSASPLEKEKVCPLIAKTHSPYSFLYDLKDTSEINSLVRNPDLMEIFPKNLRFVWAEKPMQTEENESELLELFALKTNWSGEAALQGDVISDARQEFDQGNPIVNMEMNLKGARQWKKITSDNIDRQIAIVMDNHVYSAPFVRNEIPNGSSSISGNFTIDEAKDLANVLKSGKMPAPTVIVEDAVVGPSLGADAIHQGLLSMAAGLALVVLFMIVYYKTGGVIANLALLLNCFFIVGVLAQFNTSLTLPGIAGIVLTIGMSVDANVLIFERIKEEIRNGHSIIKSIKMGYDKAYSSILDSNITTFLTGVILFAFGSGVVKGFAVVLMIGILSSLFTAVFITRMIIEGMAKRKKLTESSFDTFLSHLLIKRPNFDFIKFRRYAYVFSAVVIIAGFSAAMINGGYNFGIDFKGGRSYIVQFDQIVDIGTLRSTLSEKFRQSGLEIKSFGGDHQLKITTGYFADDDSEAADQAVKAALVDGLQVFSDSNPQIIGSSKVAATMAEDIQDTARSTIIYSLLVIFLYILLRFKKWQFGLGAIVALFHDVVIVFALFGLAGLLGIHLEIDQVFVAAVLTIIGYSINDTVVVFDRIREFTKGRENFGKHLNTSINETLSRTLITSVTVFIVVAVLLMYGGEVLRGFSFALLVGVIFGTYSSIFIASPIVFDFEKASHRRQASPTTLLKPKKAHETLAGKVAN